MSKSNSTSAIDSAEALLTAYTAGERSFMGVSLRAANLSRADLKGADLSYADLSTADLSHANLRGADFSYANLHEANLFGADLRGAMLIGTDLGNAALESADLNAADYDPEATRFPLHFNPLKAGLRIDRTLDSTT